MVVDQQQDIQKDSPAALNQQQSTVFEFAIQSVDHAILIADDRGTSTPLITFANAYMSKVTGYSLNELLGQPLSLFFGHATNPALISWVEHSKEIQPFLIESPTYPKQGEPFYAEWQMKTVLHPESQQTCWLIVIRDITEQRHTQQLLWQREKLDSLGVLAGGIAHDFNNLLAVILGNTSLMLSEIPADSPLSEMLYSTEAAALRATELTRQMMVYAGLDRMRAQIFNLNQMIEELSATLIISFLPDIRIDLRLDPQLPVLLADAANIRQTLRNLLINAAEAIGTRPGTITITTQSIELTSDDLLATHVVPTIPPGHYAQVHIRDTGIGMDADTIARAFEPFFTTKFIGRGLGLAEAYGIVSAHHGALKFKSSIGQGTLCELLLPILSE
jgi:two-component system, cell cycle sensor histidine kinase and response regulator CckA